MKTIFSNWSLLLWLLVPSLLFTACEDEDEDQLSIFELAQATPELSILVSALEATGLDAGLASPGNFTVFAPTNAAFEQYLDDNNFADLDDIPEATLRSVILYHVLGAAVRSGDITQPIYASTASPVPADFGDGIFSTTYVSNDANVAVNGVSDVTTADLGASNGVVHIVDAVIPLPTVVTFATADPSFSSLVEALTRADLSVDFVDVLTGEGPFTVFAPTNQAFQNLLASNDDWNTLDDIPAEILEEVLLYHVAEGNVRSDDLTDGQVIPTLATGESLTVDLGASQPSLEDASGESSTIIFVNVQGFNGVVHVIDRVLLPNL